MPDDAIFEDFIYNLYSQNDDIDIDDNQYAETHIDLVERTNRKRKMDLYCHICRKKGHSTECRYNGRTNKRRKIFYNKTAKLLNH